MLFSETEFAALVEPLLSEVPDNREEATALIAFSHLCEPSDLLPGFLRQFVAAEVLLLELINRADAVRMAGVIGEDGVAAIEEELETPVAEIWDNACQRWLPRLSKNGVMESLEWMNQGSGGVGKRRRILLQGGPDWPSNLQVLRHHEPSVLWTIGDETLVQSEHLISVVGTRQSSRYGIEVAREIAAVSAMNGLVTVSGGAFGIDAVMHESALALDSPTIAFMAGGLGNLYPRNNLEILLEIADKGLLVSESPPAVTPAKWRFLMRNRLIAALGNSTIVIEAGRTSGALNTAASALRFGREVAIVPGPITSSRSIGCHDFLNKNLGEVQVLARVQDVIRLAGKEVAETANERSIGVLERRALDAFGNSPIESWEVQRLAGLTVRESQIALGSLEMLGLVERRGGRYLRAVAR